MASQLQETLSRIVAKSDVLVEKYRALRDEKEELEVNVEMLTEELEQKNKQIEQLKLENEYLKLARNLVPDSTQAQHARRVISKMMQDIDKCIAQLNE